MPGGSTAFRLGAEPAIRRPLRRARRDAGRRLRSATRRRSGGDRAASPAGTGAATRESTLTRRRDADRSSGARTGRRAGGRHASPAARIAAARAGRPSSCRLRWSRSPASVGIGPQRPGAAARPGRARVGAPGDRRPSASGPSARSTAASPAGRRIVTSGAGPDRARAHAGSPSRCTSTATSSSTGSRGCSSRSRTQRPGRRLGVGQRPGRGRPGVGDGPALRFDVELALGVGRPHWTARARPAATADDAGGRARRPAMAASSSNAIEPADRLRRASHGARSERRRGSRRASDRAAAVGRLAGCVNPRRPACGRSRQPSPTPGRWARLARDHRLRHRRPADRLMRRRCGGASGQPLGPAPAAVRLRRRASQSTSAHHVVRNAISGHGIASGANAWISSASGLVPHLAADDPRLVDEHDHGGLEPRVQPDDLAGSTTRPVSSSVSRTAPSVGGLVDLEEAARLGPPAATRLEAAADEDDLARLGDRDAS